MNDTSLLTDAEVGKDVLNSDGDHVGRVVSVEHGTAQVAPDPGLTESIRSKLGWGDRRESFRLVDSDVRIVSDTEIHLHR